MEFNYRENSTDMITGRKVGINNNNNQLEKIRITIKDGVTSLNNIYGSALYSVDNGIDNALISSPGSTFPVGKNIVLYVRGTYGNSINVSQTSLQTFLSSIEVLHDSLYFVYNSSYDKNININSPLFEAPNGIFDIMQSVTFNGSTFKKGPKIYSERAMKATSTWPYTPGNSTLPSNISSNTWTNLPVDRWRPFANCPNLQSIENQGSLGSALKYVFPCELHINKKDEPCDLSAYPSMEEATPTHIVSYISGDIVNISSLNKNLINTTKIDYLYYPFSFNKYILDSVSSNNLPLGGIDVAGKTMKNCSLDLMNLEFTGSFEDTAYNEFTVSYAHFGVFAPEYAEVCENLHSYYMNIPKEIEYNVKEKEDWVQWKTSQKNYLLTPQTIKNHCNEAWGEALIELWDEEWIDEENQIPSYPQGVKRLMGYMDKYFIENSFVTWEEVPDEEDNEDNPYTIEEKPTNPNVFAGVKYGMKGNEDGFFNDFSSIQRVLHKDNEPFLFVPRRISLVDDRAQVTNLYRNLFANLVIDQPITVPRLPSETQYANFCYTGMFANSTGLEVNEYNRIAKKTTPITFYTRGYAHNSLTINGSQFPVVRLNDPTFSNSFWDKFNNQNSEYGFAVAQGHIDEDYIDYSEQNTPRIVPWSGWNDTTSGYEAYRGYDNRNFYWEFPLSQEINSKSDILNYIYDLSQMEVFMRTKRFNHAVTFEEQNLPNLKASAYCFNQVFYGSNPNINIGNIVSSIPDTGLNGRNYDQAYIFNYFESKLMRPVIITGYFENDVEKTISGQEIVSETESYKYMIVLFYENWDISEIDPSFAVGEEIVNKMPATRNIYQSSYTGLKVKQMFSSVSRDIIEDFEDKESTVLQPLLTSREIQMTTSDFFAPSSNNQRDPFATKETFSVGLGVKASKLPGDVWPVKKPTGYTQVLLATTHKFISASLAVRTFSTLGYSTRYPQTYNYNFKQIPVGSTTVYPGVESL